MNDSEKLEKLDPEKTFKVKVRSAQTSSPLFRLPLIAKRCARDEVEVTLDSFRNFA